MQQAEQYTTVKREAHVEFEEKRSLFIGYAIPLKSEDQATEFIKKIKNLIKLIQGIEINFLKP